MVQEQQLTILGCGSSGGVPRIGGNWGVCDPNDPRNVRTRCSVIFSQRTDNGITKALIDTSPDLRQQFLDNGIDWVDTVLMTHHHADQAHGLDDLRPMVLSKKQSVPFYMDRETAENIVPRFQYAFETPLGSPYPPFLLLHNVEAGDEVSVDGDGGILKCKALAQEHGNIASLGYRMGTIAYSNDLHAMPEETFAELGGLDVWCVDVLRYTPHPSHAHWDLVMEWIDRLKPRVTILTNMHVDLDYAEMQSTLSGKNIVPATDGMTATVRWVDGSSSVSVYEPKTDLCRNFP